MAWDYIAESLARMDARCERLATDCQTLTEDLQRRQDDIGSLIQEIDRILATEGDRGGRN